VDEGLSIKRKRQWYQVIHSSRIRWWKTQKWYYSNNKSSRKTSSYQM